MTKRGYVLFLIFAGLLVFFNCLFNGFVWDDEEQILNNVLVHSISNFFSFFGGSTFNTGGSGVFGGLYYKPMMTVFFSFIYSFFGANSFFFHLFQVGLHITNSIFVFLIFTLLFKSSNKYSLSFILALIFLIHPINAEAVAYISCFQDILFFFFGIIAFWLIVSKRINSFKGCLVLFILLLCSLLSKETGILFLIIIAVYIFLFSKKYLKPYLITAFFSVTAYSFLRFIIAGIFLNKHGLTPISTLPFFERLLSVPQIAIFYLKTFFYPLDLSISQHWVVKSANTQDFYLPLMLCILGLSLLVGIFMIFYFKKNQYTSMYLFFLIWFLLGIALHLQIIFPLDMTVSERWFYFPIIGLLGLLGIIISQIRFNNIIKNISWGLLLIIIIFLGVRTIVRNTNWKSGLSLYSHDVLIATNTFDLENNLGVELYRAGKFDEAEEHFENSTKLAPNWWTNWNNLGAMFERRNDLSAAKIYYQKAIDNGQYYLAYENLAKIYLKNESPENTIAFTEKSLIILPNNSTLWFVLSVSEYKLGNKEKALIAARNAYLLNQNQQNLYIYSRLSQNLPLEF